jgi:hypothetical protein
VKTPPYPNISVDDFLPSETIKAMKQECEKLTWTREFTRNGSHMLEKQDVDDCPVAVQVKNALSSKKFLIWLGEVTGHHDLIPDPHMVGAGYMRCTRGDSLKLHSDFNFNNTLKLYRMLSINIYLNQGWQPEWNGDLQFWDFDKTEKVVSYPPKMGNAVIWKYHKRGFHGHPNPIECPEERFRVGVRLFYYVSDSTHDWRDPPHKSLYWYDKDKNQPYHLDNEYGHGKLEDD